MTSAFRSYAIHAAVPALLLAGGCAIDVRERDEGVRKEVDIRTPVGNVSVKSDIDVRDTGLPLYPGARPLQEDDDPESAVVNVGNAWFGVKVVAAKFESDAAVDPIVTFYRNEMKAYGAVTECRGDIDFRGRRGIVCDDRPAKNHTQLVVGTEDRHRIVVVKPRPGGSELSLVYVQTRGDS